MPKYPKASNGSTFSVLTSLNGICGASPHFPCELVIRRFSYMKSPFWISWSTASALPRQRAGECHQHSSMSQALIERGVILVSGGVPSFSMPLEFLWTQIHTMACSLPPDPREGLKAAAPDVPQGPLVHQGLPGTAASSTAALTELELLVDGCLANPAQPRAGQGQPSHTLGPNAQTSLIFAPTSDHTIFTGL